VTRVAALHADTVERMTMQIATCLQEQLRAKGVGVVLEAEHRREPILSER